MTKGPLCSRVMEGSLVVSELISIVIIAMQRLLMFEIQMDHIAYTDSPSVDINHLES